MGKASRRKKERREAEERYGTRREDHDDGTSTVHWESGSEAGEFAQWAMETQCRRFREKFGRDIGPDDPLMFDPDADEPRPMPVERIEAKGVEVLRKFGFDSAYIYAYQQTGLMVSPYNRHLLSDDDLAEFQEAVDRYHALHGGE